MTIFGKARGEELNDPTAMQRYLFVDFGSEIKRMNLIKPHFETW